jgi:cell division protein FtsI/penicillin-binding protein 2
MVKKYINKMRQKKYSSKDIDLDEVFLDSENIPDFDQYQLEGRIEKPISKKVIFLMFTIFIFIFVGFGLQVWNLQIINGEAYSKISSQNTLRHSLIFSDRGIVYDRNQVPLVWNENQDNEDFSKRKYIERPGFANLLGYVKYPRKDSSGFYFSESFEPVGGIEQAFNDIIAGQNGIKIVETNALMEVVGNNTIKNPVAGKSLNLSIDSGLQEKKCIQLFLILLVELVLWEVLGLLWMLILVKF